MLTDAMMLVSPFHADYEFLARPYHEAAPELWDTEGAGLAGLSQEVAAALLEESFEVVDAASAIEWCDSLEAEAGLWPDSSLVAAHVPAVSMLAGSAVAAGFDCCRVINILTSARAAGYIDERTLAALLERYVQGFVDRCSGWGQYLASVIVGKVAFQVMYATPETRHVDATIILEGAHIMALTDPVTLFRTGIWPTEDLSALISAIEALIPTQRVRAVRLGAKGWLATAEHPLDSATAKVLENADTDAGTFLRARALAQEVFWRPADAGGIGGIFEDLRTARIPLWDLPARGDGAAATTFWTDSSLDQEHWSGVPFLRTSEGARLTAVMTEDACFLVSRKALRRVFTPIPWEQVRFTVSVMPGQDIVFYANGKKLGTLFPDWDVVGVINPDLPLHLEAFMNGLGPRVRAFSAAYPI